MKAKPDFHSATQPEWNLACEREAVIRPLAQGRLARSRASGRRGSASWLESQFGLTTGGTLQTATDNLQFATGQGRSSWLASLA